MKLSNQLCTPQQAIQLVHLGVDESLCTFKFVKEKEDEDWDPVYAEGYNWSDYPCYSGYPFVRAAFTTGELGIMLNLDNTGTPTEHKMIAIDLAIQIKDNCKNESDMRAECLIQLITTGHLKVGDVNERLKNS